MSSALTDKRGLKASSVVPSNNGLTTTLLCAAYDLERVGSAGDTEDVRVHTVPFADVDA